MIKKENSNEFIRNSDIHGKISDILENKQGIYRMSIELESQNEEHCQKLVYGILQKNRDSPFAE